MSSKEISKAQMLEIIARIEDEANEFELLDFYLMTGISLKEFKIQTAELLTLDQREAFEGFYLQNIKKIIIIDKETLLNLEVYINGVTFNHKEKLEIINFIENNNLPMSAYIFSQIAKRKIAKQINLDKVYLQEEHRENIFTDYAPFSKVNKVLEGISNGVKVSDDEVIPFELLDYYEIIKMPLQEFRRQIRYLTKEGRQLFYKFYKQNRYMETTEGNDTIFDSIFFVDNRYIDEEEKYKIINYMMRHNLPLYQVLFLQISRRYVKGYIDIDDEVINYDTDDVKRLQRIFTNAQKYDTIKRNRNWRD